MKRIFIVILLLFVCNTVFSQNDFFKVKEGSFKHIPNAVMDDKYEHTDGNDLPMALIKISTENIPEQERLKLLFSGNRATQIVKTPKTGQMWIYITANSADFIEIKHPDYGTCKYYLPEQLCDFCTYEMVLQYIDPTPVVETGFLAVSTEPNEADVYVDGKNYGKTTAFITDLAEGSHTLKLEKQGYVTLTKTINIVKGETLKLNETLQTLSSQKTYLIVKADQLDAMIYIDDEPINTGEASKSVNIGSTHTYRIECDLYHTETGTVTVTDRVTVDKKLRPNFGYINVTTTPEQGAKVYVDGKYIGDSPIKTDKLASGTHTVRVMKEMFKMKEQTFNVTDGQTTNAALNMAANFVSVTINTDSDSDIYVDEEYKGKGRWTGRVSDGIHNLEARKQNHRSSKKTVELVLGVNKTITLESPKPISGSIDINSSPMGANIYIDGKNYGQTPNYINNVLIGTHELKLEKQGCATLTKSINIKESETLMVNEKLQTGKEISISTDESGDKIYVDGNYVGLSPISSNLSFGSHEIKAERDGKTTSKNIEVSQYGGDDSVKLSFGEVNGHEYVDLGLPSGLRWATCNVGANKPEEFGDHFAWGETTPKRDYTEDNSLTHMIAEDKLYAQCIVDKNGNLTPWNDAATANWGGTWRMPTNSELEELKDKCTWTWTTQNGVEGYKVTGPNGNSIFLPAAGYNGEKSVYNLYWSSSHPDYDRFDSYADNLFLSWDEVLIGHYNSRYNGASVRPVNEKLQVESQHTVDNIQQISGEINGHEYVDLGLPSGLKWATCNVGANKPEDYGNYYAWGETTTKSEYSDNNSLTYEIKKSRLQKQGIIDSNGNLTSSYDVATANWGGTWRMPTESELEELVNKCTWTLTKQNNVVGYKVTGPNGNHIFLPAAGDRSWWSSLRRDGSHGNYWSSTPNETYSDYACDLEFYGSDIDVSISGRETGQSVRPVSF